jgi:NhaC family Na+:H+ antiporter
MQAILIMMIIGPLIASWMAAGIVPAMVFYGLKIMSPTFFLTISVLICSVVSLAIGSSWTTMATVGLALFGIGTGLGINPAMTVGAIVSGAYFGDKMSPFSDTTNLAPGVAGTDLFSHIRHMVWTTGPSYLITLAVFTAFGLASEGKSLDQAQIDIISNALGDHFNITPILLIPVILLLVMVKLKTPALPSLIIATFVGYVCALAFQGVKVGELLNGANYGFSIDTGVDIVNSLVNRGGFQSMMWTVSLIIIALAFAGIIERAGMLNAIVSKVLARVKTERSLIRATLVTALLTVLLTGCQYTAILLTGKAYKEAYENMGLDGKNLSRATEDVGTLFEPVVPWGLSSAYIFGLFGVLTINYAPYAILNWVNFFVAMGMATMGLSIARVGDSKLKKKLKIRKDSEEE